MMLTIPSGAPPLQVTSRSWLRGTLLIESLFSQLRFAGSVRLELNWPTSTPPGPVIV